MSWLPDELEIQSVLQLDGPRRYDYCTKRVADQGQLWSLRQRDGWALAGDDEGHELIPIWPHEKFAALCAKGEWLGFEPERIALDAWLERWISGMKKDGRLVAVFPIPKNRGVAVDPIRLEADLRQELSKYE